MNEYEILDIQSTYVAALGTDIMNFISILSGYLLASYFLGAKLKISQFIVLTLSYSIIMFVVMASIFVSYDEIQATEFVLKDMERTWGSQKLHMTQEGLEGIKYIIISTHLLIYFGSIYFAIVSRLRRE